MHDNDEDTKESWAAHEFTRKTLRLLRDQAKAYEGELMGAAMRSTDPDVRWAHARLHEAKVQIAFYEKAGVK